MFSISKDKIDGLVDFLVNDKFDWKKACLNKFDLLPTFDILFSGSIPPNPLNLINNGNFEKLVDDAKNYYDYVIIDTAPTLLVADTKSLFPLADAVLLMTRCNLTNTEILKHVSKLKAENKINLGLILNSVGEKNAYGYSYGYKYGYNYRYSYNYGYGYGYNEDNS